MPGDDLNHDKQPRRKKNRSLVFGVLAAGFVLGCGLIFGGYLAWDHAVKPARLEVTTAHNLQQIGLAIHKYHDPNYALPNNTYDPKVSRC